MVIRKMLHRDLDQVSALEAEIFSVPWSRQGFADSLEQENTIYLVVLDGTKVVGYCGMLQALDEADITNVAVDQAYRGRGIGQAMLRDLMGRGEQRGITAYTLEVRVGNKPARILYQKLGFQEEGIRKNFYQKPTEDAVIMWKR